MGSRWGTPHDEKILVNSGGILPDLRVQSTPDGASQTRDGGSAAFDFVSTYSNHHTTAHLADTLQNRFTRTAPMAEEDEPFIMAVSAALLSIHKTHVRGLPSDWYDASQAVRIVAASSKRYIGDSASASNAMSTNHVGK